MPIAVIVIVIVMLHMCESYFITRNRVIREPLLFSSKKNNNNINSNDWGDIPSFEDNIPMSKRRQPELDIEIPVKKEKNPVYSSSRQSGPPGKTVSPANISAQTQTATQSPNWRDAMSKPSKQSIISQIVNNDKILSAKDSKGQMDDDYLRGINPYSVATPVKIKNIVKSPSNLMRELDFDYNDFEEAMMEEEDATGLGGSLNIVKLSSKPNRSGQRVYTNSDITNNIVNVNPNGNIVPYTAKTASSRLSTGDIVSREVWQGLVDHEGKGFEVDKAMRLNTLNDVIIVFADPRRINEEFKTVTGEYIHKYTLLCSITLFISVKFKDFSICKWLDSELLVIVIFYGP